MLRVSVQSKPNIDNICDIALISFSTASNTSYRTISRYIGVIDLIGPMFLMHSLISEGFLSTASSIIQWLDHNIFDSIQKVNRIQKC